MVRPKILAALILLFSFPAFGESLIMPVPLYVDQTYLGEIDLNVEDGTIKLQAHPLVIRLEEYLDETKARDSLNRWSPDQWVTPESLSASVIRPFFDEDNLILVVEIPPESRKPGVILLSGTMRKPPEKYVSSGGFSALLNLDLWTNFHYEALKLDYRLRALPALQFKGYVLEARGGVQSGLTPLFFDYARVVKDFPGILYRAEAGSLTYQADGFSGIPMTGAAFFRKTSLDENYQARPALGQTLFFSRPADVVIRVNDRVVSRERVPTGTWTFESFPLVQGANEIVIAWTDESGERERRLFHIYDGELLKPGEYDYGAALGTVSLESPAPALLFHMNNGINPSLTMGARLFYGINDYHLALGAPITLATSFGSFYLDSRLDLYLAGGAGTDINLSYSLSRKREDLPDLRLGAALDLDLASYPVEESQVGLSGYYSFTPVSGLSLTPTLGWSWNMVENIHNLDLRARVRKSTPDGSVISADLGIRHDKEGWAPQASITFSASLHEIQQNFYARGDLSGEKMTLSWSRYAGGDGEGDYNLGATGIIPANPEDRLTLSFNGGFAHPYFTFNASQAFNAFLEAGDITNSTSLSLGSALVYTDGVLGVTRPISGSFILVKSDLGNLEVNPSSRGALLTVYGDTVGVIDSAAPYRYTTYRLSPETLPVGSDINDYTKIVYPTYRSGILLLAQPRIFMYAGGTLLDREGAPLGLITGSIDGREFFTDESGYFECYGLTPGEYTLDLEEGAEEYTIEIKVHDSGFWDLGEVSPEG